MTAIPTETDWVHACNAIVGIKEYYKHIRASKGAVESLDLIERCLRYAADFIHALPPLRAREEWLSEAPELLLRASAMLANVVNRSDVGPHHLVSDLVQCLSAAILSSTAGQEWRDISSEPNDGKFRFYGLHVQHDGLGRVFEAHYIAMDEDGQLILPGGDNFDDWHFTDFEVWCDAPPLPAPPVAEPIVAEESQS